MTGEIVTLLRIIAIVFVLMLAMPSAQSTRPIGLLLGVASPTTENENGQQVLQKLETHWVELPSVGTPLVVEGAIVPRKAGFDRFVMSRRCGVIEGSETASGINRGPHIECDDELARWQLGEPMPRRDVWKPVGDEGTGPCRSGYRELVFASPALLAFKALGRQSEGCEPRGGHWLTESWVQRIDDDDGHIALTAVAGGASRHAYAAAAIRARQDWIKVNELSIEQQKESCLPDGLDDYKWHIERRRSRWIPMLVQQPGNGFCDMQAPIEFALPATALGFVEPAIDWPQLQKQFADAVEAHASPDGDWRVIVRENEIVVANRRGEPRTILPPARIVMVQWASGANVARWRRELQRYRE